MRVVVDALGGDFGSSPIIEGVVKALREQSFEAILVGRASEILPLIPDGLKDKVSIIETDDVISMDDRASDALKRKESSIYKSIELLRDAKADAVISAGHSGASMSLATLRIGRIKGILRPAIATLMPQVSGGSTLVLDVGANVDCKAEHLNQFAIMGICYARDVMGIDSPKVGILSNGEESSKGNEVTKEAFSLISNMSEFIGNVEGSDIFNGKCDVVICDGFVGNVLLKASEGVADSIGKILKNGIKSSLIAKIGAILMSGVFRSLKKRVDYAEYGGAPLLGVNGCVIISHGKSNSKAIKNAIFQAINFADSRVNQHIQDKLK